MARNRVDVLESRVGALVKGRPDNVIAETGVLSELKNHAYRTRFGQHRTDLKHLSLDLLMWAAPYAAIAGGLYLAGKGIRDRRRLRRRRSP